MLGHAQTLFAQSEGLHIERMDGDGWTAPYAAFIDAHHSYIDFHERPARALRWLLYEGRAVVGAFEIVSGWTFPKDVRAFMGEHALDFNEIGNNSIYCLAGATSHNAASRFLAMLRRDGATWWSTRYGNRLRALQTFILPPRLGTCYIADNWKRIGTTSGHGQITHTPRGLTRRPLSERVVRTSVVTTPKIIFARTPVVKGGQR